MCGIIANFRPKSDKKEPVNQFIINQFENQHIRGTRGFGIIRISHKGKIEIDRACETAKFLIDLYLKPAEMIITHHRTPTSTENQLEQTHPILVSNSQLKYDYLVVHNGIVTSDYMLHQKHLELGFKYTTEYQESWGVGQTTMSKWNDSESIAIELALFIEKKIEKIGTNSTAAFIILQIDKKNQKANQVFFGKNGTNADLNIDKTDKEIKISSEGPGLTIQPNELYSFSLQDPTMALTAVKIPFLERETYTPPALPATTPTNPQNQIKTQANPNKIRSWSSPELIDEIDDIDLPAFAGKEYIKETEDKFREKIKDQDAIMIIDAIEEQLEKEVDKITDIITDYKAALLDKRLEDKETNFYSGQIFRIIKAMQTITNLAETNYQTKEIEAEKFDWERREMEDDYQRNNVGFKP